MKIKGFKGFNSKLQCIPNDEVFQYEVGKTYEEDAAALCICGFHFCKDPLDCFKYYLPSHGSRYCEIEADNVSDETKKNNKCVCKRLNIKEEIGLQGLIQAGVNFRLNKTNRDKVKKSTTEDSSVAFTTRDCDIATATGESSIASATGWRSVAFTTGSYSAASVTGDEGAAYAIRSYSAASATGNGGVALAIRDRSIALSTGDCSTALSTGINSAASVDKSGSIASAFGTDGKAKGAIGSWIILSEWAFEEEWVRKDVQCRLVDGEQIKADTWYKLKDGMFVEVDE